VQLCCHERAVDLVFPAARCVDGDGVQEPLLEGLEEGESRDEDGSPVFASAAAFGPAGIPVVKAKGSAHAVQKPSSGRVLGSLADRTNLQEDLVEEGGAVMIDFRDALPECPPEGSSSGEAAATVCNA
jgi:hypothetical protein